MSDNIQVDFGAISNLAGGIDSQVKQIEGQLEQLKAAIQKLGTEWEGGANAAFAGVQQNWNNSADDLHQVLNRIALAVHAAHDAYHETEQKNTSVWG
ncbi:MAG TPA: WXG100 family type VII secretion target [Pseudonocardiaceae bacterium]|jgi:WXG100 family type VII secretion target|nr:WXG100 family type VII secretion target [Pseudonocardiaceae bacterium]